MIRAYIVDHDLGFAPNPFYGVCTLATCKPQIRQSAALGEWIAGLGSKALECRGRLIFAMLVEEKLTFDQYWSDERFQDKKPIFSGSLKQAQGDNIYHKDSKGRWIQEQSRHSHPDPAIARMHLKRDTKSEFVLLGRYFAYFGENALEIPDRLRAADGRHLSLSADGTPGGHLARHRNFDEVALEEQFVQWLTEVDRWGYQGDPHEWSHEPQIVQYLDKWTFA